VLAIWGPLLHKRRVTTALAAQRKDTPLHLPSLQPFDCPHPNPHLLSLSTSGLPLPSLLHLDFPHLDFPHLNLLPLIILLLGHLPLILEERVTPLPPLDAVLGKILRIWSSRIIAVLRNGHALTHLKGLPVQSNPRIKTIWTRHKTLETKSHPRQRQARAVRAVRVVRVNERRNRPQVPFPEPGHLARPKAMETSRFHPTTIFQSPIAYPSYCWIRMMHGMGLDGFCSMLGRIRCPEGVM
jgi:hypothetical protein